MNQIIRVIISDIKLAERDVKEIKKEIRDMEKINTPEYLELKKQRKILHERMKEIEKEYKEDLEKDSTFIQLKKLKLESDERLGQANGRLQKELVKKYGEPTVSEDFSIETDFGPIRFQVLPTVHAYLNGIKTI